MGLLQDKVVVITGASSGIGRACALECAKHDAKVLIHHLGTKDTERDADELKKLLTSQYSTHCVTYGGDLTGDGIPDALIREAVTSFGRVDVLINNAAIFQPFPADEVTKGVVQKHIDVNFIATYMVVRAATLQMVAQGKGGSVVNMSSNTALVGVSGLAHYAGSKAGSLSLMTNFAVEFGPHGIRYNSILPGPTDTNMVATYTNDPQQRESMISRCPMGRLGQPEDVAKAIVFFASDLSGFVSGQQIFVDGGSSTRFL